jgi:transcriptional regulator with XRE-family HTH domain
MAKLLIIRDLLERKKMTLRDFSHRIGMSEDGLQKIIRNGSTNTKTIEVIAKELDVPVGIFFDDTPLSTITQKGGKNTASIYGNISLSDCQKEVKHLRELLKEKERTIQDKERTIQILMNK